MTHSETVATVVVWVLDAEGHQHAEEDHDGEDQVHERARRTSR